MTPCMLILTGLTTSRKNKEEGTLKERNIILEGKLKSWLLSVDIEKLAAKQQGQLILGLERQRAAFPIIYLAMRYLQYVQWILYTIRRTQQLKRQKKPF